MKVANSQCREAFAAWLPGWGVPFSYAVAIAYVLTDTADKGAKAYRTSDSELSANPAIPTEVNVPRYFLQPEMHAKERVWCSVTVSAGLWRSL